jgi:hypothetical protein
MGSLILSVVVRPFFLLALLLAAALIASSLRRFIPHSAIKSYLYRKHPIIPATEAERRDWTAPLAMFAATGVLFWWILFLNG